MLASGGLGQSLGGTFHASDHASDRVRVQKWIHQRCTPRAFTMKDNDDSNNNDDGIIAFAAELNGLQLWATDIGNAYLEAYTSEKVFFIAGPAFGDREGHLLLRALTPPGVSHYFSPEHPSRTRDSKDSHSADAGGRRRAADLRA